MPTVEPAVWSPAETIGHRVASHLIFETIEHDLRRAVWNGVAVLVRNEKQIRQRQRPYATQPDFDARQPLRAIPEHRALVEAPIIVGVLEHNDAVAQFL